MTPRAAPLAGRIAWLLMTVMAIGIAGYSIMLFMHPERGAPFVADRFRVVPLAITGHLLGSALALFVGAFQVNARLRDRYLTLHRWAGRLYVIGVAVGGVSALVLATRSEGGMITHLGFGALGTAWLLTTGLAYYHIRDGKREIHRRWMIRSYALTLAAVTLRIYLPLSLANGIPFEAAYRVISWACWVPNLLVAEWWLRRRRLPGARVIA